MKVKKEKINDIELEAQIEELENIVFPELLGVKLNEEILNNKTDHGHKLQVLFYPLKSSFIKFTTSYYVDNFTKYLEIADEFNAKLIEFNTEMQNIYRKWKPQYTSTNTTDSSELIIKAHEKKLAEIKVPAPTA